MRRARTAHRARRTASVLPSLLLLLLFLAGSWFPAGSAWAEDDPPELRLVKALDAMQSGQPDAAFSDIERLVHEQPNFRLAQLIYADLLRARAGAPRALGVESSNVRLQQLIAEARLRWRDRQNIEHGDRVPAEILRLAPGARAIVVDLSGARLYLMQGDGQGWPRVVDSDYAGSGVAGYGKQREGDGKTPVGLYTITGFLPASELPAVYGHGALVLSYPNRIDVAHQRTGSGIWIHGVPPNTYTRAPRSSKGCVTLANHQLDQLRLSLGPDASVVILDGKLGWVTPAAARQQRDTLLVALSRWRDALSAGDHAALASWYAADFDSDDDNPLSALAQLKQGNLHLREDDLSVFRYPGETGLYLLRYSLHYETARSSGDVMVEQLWQKRGQRWLIRYEGRHALAPMS